ncbi:MFS transporter [Corallococcus sp. CA047B]|uniref:MFS transporter n=1 Tax=Corallococcus sp. CA047B TaxID=2316729 RepID=UPI000EA07F50|nr:MFS transporter [Corallococcus sp. CA047B]RKH18190.1 MFS transporter [Corallococcus sp. CA047B]
MYLRHLRNQLAAIPFAAWIIIGGQFLVGLGNVGPILSIFFQGSLELRVLEISALLSVRLWSQRGGAVFAGIAADRFGARRTMVAGLLIRGASNVLLAVATGFPGLLLGVFLMGAGSALFTPASKKALLGAAGKADPVFLLSLRNASRNLGFAVGPTACLLIAASSMRLALFLAAATSLVFAVAAQGWAPADAVREQRTSWHPAVAVRDLSNRRVLLLFCALVFFFALYTQLEFTVSLVAEATYSRSAVALLWISNAIAVVLLQLWLSGWMARNAIHVVVGGGLATFAFAFLLFALNLGLPVFLLGVFVFTVGEIVVEPKVDDELARLLPSRSLATGFGLLGFALSIGGTLGYYLGGRALDVASSAARYAPMWLAFGAVAALGAATVFMTFRSAFARPLEAPSGMPNDEVAG